MSVTDHAAYTAAGIAQMTPKQVAAELNGWEFPSAKDHRSNTEHTKKQDKGGKQ